MTKAKPMVQITFRLSPEAKETLESIAAKLGLSVTKTLDRVITIAKETLDDLETE